MTELYLNILGAPERVLPLIMGAIGGGDIKLQERTWPDGGRERMFAEMLEHQVEKQWTCCVHGAELSGASGKSRSDERSIEKTGKG